MFRRLIFPIILLLLLSGGARVIGQDKDNTVPADEETQEAVSKENTNPYFERLAPPDRTALRRFDQARRLIETERLAEAAQLLGAILEGPVDFFVVPPYEGGAESELRKADKLPDIPAFGQAPPEKKDGRGVDPASQTTGTLFGDLVLETLRGLPAKARESYVLQFEAQARRLLEIAVRDGSIEGVQYVAKRYFLTPPGAEAAFLLGIDQMDRGALEAAALTLDRLNRSRADLLPFEPTLSLSLASCQLRLGREEEARQTVDRFLQRMPKPEILLFGKDPWKPGSADEIVERLEKIVEPSSLISLSAWLERTGWLLGHGIPSQNAETAAQKPLLELLWSVPSLDKPLFQRESRPLMSAVEKEKQVYIPASQPLVVQDRVLARGVGELMAVDAETGKYLWTASEPEYRIAKSVQSPVRINLPQWRIGGMDVALSLRLHFWHDRISHQLSSDGKRLFSIDGHDLRAISYAAWGQGGVNLRIGRKTIEDPRSGPGNTLSARDVETGRILWQVGKFPYVQKYFDQSLEDYEQEELRKKSASGEKKAETKDEAAMNPDRDFTDEERFLGETWFLGAPLPLEGNLYVIGENGGLLRLIVLNGENGRLIRQVPLAVPPSSFESDPLRKFFALLPSASEGILLCPTALGMVVALDATTATPLWCFAYQEPLKDEAESRNRRNMRHFPLRVGGGEDFRTYFKDSGWQVPSIMVDGRRVLVAPPDDPGLYCLDLATGRLLWKNDRIGRENTLYVACIRKDTAYIVTSGCMSALDMRSGSLLWDLVSNSAKTGGKETGTNDRGAGRPKLPFPAAFKPGGVGVHNDGLYFLPFSNGCLGVVDLDRAAMEIMSSGSALPEAATVSVPDEPRIPDDSGLSLDETFGNTPLFAFDHQAAAWMPSTELSDRKAMSLGNLVGIRGRFFSQTPTQIDCFDQWVPLEQRALALLDADPADPVGLLQLGRIRRAEGKTAEAVDLFRRAMKGPGVSEYAADCLRKTLLEAMKADYDTWKNGSGELENLAVFPEELGEILYVIARGALRSGDSVSFLETLQKAFHLEIDHSIQVPVDSGHYAQLHQALRILLERSLRNRENGSFQEELGRVAETIFRGLTERRDAAEFLPALHLSGVDTAKNRFLMRPWWEEETTALSSEAYRWRVFRELFRGIPVSDRTERILDDYYRKNRLYSALELRVNPPVDWVLPEEMFDLAAGEPGENSAVSAKPLPSSPSSPPYFPKKTPAPEDLRRLAEYLVSQENVADALVYYRRLEKSGGAEGKRIWREAAERPDVKRRLDWEQAAAHWPDGKVSVEEGPGKEREPATQDARGNAVASILRSAKSGGNLPVNRRALPLFGSFEPFLSPYSYCLETLQYDVYLVCCDRLGGERWRCRVSAIASDMAQYGYFSENHIYSILGSSDQTVYLIGCNHLLLFVRDNELIAFDTFRYDPDEGPRILWTKTLPVKLPYRQMYGALPMSNLQAYAMQPNHGFPRQSVFVGPQVICYRDSDRVFGLDPLNGQVLWSRETPSSHCSILGDRENLFLVFPDIHQAVAVDPRSGMELAVGTIPAGGIFTFETNIVFLKQVAPLHASNQTAPYQLLLGDLRELFQKRRRALMLSDESVRGGIPSIPTYPIREGLTHEAMVRSVHHGRFLASVSWTSKTLQIYDLETKCDVLGAMGDWGRRTGVKLPETTVLRETRRRHDCDFDIELFEDRFLVYFIEKGEVNTQMKGEVNEKGVPVRRRRNAVSNLPARNFGIGSMMLYQSDGTEVWSAPVRIEDWYRMLRVPDGLPVVLFTVSMTEQEGRADENNLYTGLWGIDKRTGETRFRCWVPPLPPNLSQTMLQGFRVEADPKEKTIAFVTPNRTVLAKFTGRPNEPVKPDAKEEAGAPKTDKTLPRQNFFDRMYDMFGN